MKYSPLLVLFFLLNCNTPGDQGNNHTTQISEESEQPNDQQGDSSKNAAGCYMRVLKRDTLALHLQQQGNSVSGRLTFDNYEKDGSTGSVTGAVEGEIIKLIYSFQSEGMNSVMEVYLKISENGLVHGIGEMKVKGDTAFYAQPSKISYPDDNELERLSCENLPSKYK